MFNNLRKYNAQYLNNAIVDKISKLENLYEEENERQRISIKTKINKNKLKLALEMGDIDLSSLEEKEKIYSYWEEKSKLFDKLKEVLGSLKRETDKLDEETKENNKKFIQLIEKITTIKVNDLNYIKKRGPMKFKTNYNDDMKNAIIEAFIKEKFREDPFKEVDATQAEIQTETDKLREIEYDDESAAEVLDARKYKDGGKLRSIDVDPILFYELSKSDFSISLNEEEYNSIMQVALLTLADFFGYDTNLPEYEDLRKEIEIFIARLRETTTLMKDNYYLPTFNFLKKDAEKIDKVNDTIHNLLSTLSDTAELTEVMTRTKEEIKLETGEKKEITVERKEKAVRRKITSQTKRFTNIAELSGKNRFIQSAKENNVDILFPKIDSDEKDDIKSFEDMWQELLEVVNDYYLKPVQSKYYITQEDKPKWVRSYEAWLVSLQLADKNPIGAAISYAQAKNFAAFKSKNIDSLDTFINQLRRQDITFTSLFENAKNSVRALDSIFGKSFKDDNRESIGKYLYDISVKIFDGKVEVSGRTKDVDDVMFFKKKLEDYDDSYSETKQYPLDFLKEVFNTSEFKTLTRDEESLFDSKVIESLLKLKGTLNQFHKMDEVNLALLDAHDSIRKMNGEQIITGYLSLTNIEDMDYIITKFEDRLSITALEIEGIVKSVNSYLGISRHYGIPEETVYEIKAMFR